MSILYCDGFEQYAVAADVQTFYPNAGGVMNLKTDTVFGRGKCLNQPTGAVTYAQVSIPTQALNTVVGAGVRFRVNGGSGDGNRKYLVGFFENGVFHVGVCLNNQGGFDFYGRGGYLGYTVSHWIVGTWYHLEVKTVVDDAVGSIEVRLNGNTIWTFAGDTRNGNTGAINAVRTAWNNTTAASWDVDYDDFVVWNGLGTDSNDWLGDVEVQTLMPTADDVITGWTANTGDAWEAISEIGSDGDTTFIVCGSVGNPASFEVADLATIPGKILALQAFAIARKDDSGNRSIKVGVDSNGVAVDGSDYSLGTAYAATWAVIEKNPDGNVAWIPATVNSVKARVQVSV